MKKIIGKGTARVTMSDDEAEATCRFGRGLECCAFLIIAPDGFECIRMSYPLNDTIFFRLRNGTMNAKGEGGWEGCAWKEKIARFVSIGKGLLSLKD